MWHKPNPAPGPFERLSESLPALRVRAIQIHVHVEHKIGVPLRLANCTANAPREFDGLKVAGFRIGHGGSLLAQSGTTRAVPQQSAQARPCTLGNTRPDIAPGQDLQSIPPRNSPGVQPVAEFPAIRRQRQDAPACLKQQADEHVVPRIQVPVAGQRTIDQDARPGAAYRAHDATTRWYQVSSRTSL